MWKSNIKGTSRLPTSVEVTMGQKQPENVEYFSCLGGIIANDARCLRKIKSRVATAKAAFRKNRAHFTSKLDLNLRNKPANFYIWSIAMCGAETWTLGKAYQKYVGSFEMWC